MVRELGFSRKKTSKSAIKRNSEENLDFRLEVAREMCSAIKRNLTFIFIDESGFNASLSPLYGYSRVGQRCLISSKPDTENYSVIAAITQEKILGYQVFKGVKAVEFGVFMISLLQNNQEILQNRFN